MPINFPSNPSINQQSTQNNRIYQWTGSAWEIVGSGISLSASQISDFNSSVSGLLQVKDIVAGTGISISSNNGTYTINSTSSGGGGGVSVTELIYSYASTSGLPASGDDTKLYIITDSNRMYRWIDNTNKYVETGPIGGGDTSLWNLFLPTTPTGVTGVGRNSQVVLSWSAPTVSAQTPITDYAIQYSSDSGSSWTTFSDGVSTAISGTVTGLINGSGYIFRVAGINAVGVGTYSSASSTVTPAIGDSYFGNVQLLLHADGNTTTFIDSSSANRTITANGNATQSSTQSKWGGKSAYFDGSSDYLLVPYAASLVIGTGDFVIEGWFYFADLNYRFILGTPENANGHLMIAINPTAGNQIWVGRAGIEWPLQFSGHSLTTNTWNHIAIARNGSSNRLYINGTQIGSTITNSQNWTLNTNGIWIGLQSGGTSFNGYIDDFRITVGSARGYTNATITVPTSAFPDYS